MRNAECNSMRNAECMWPRFRKESRDFQGFHEFRISVQRLCYGKRSGCISVALHFQQNNQILKGFKIGQGLTALENGFSLEADAHSGNPFHAHIVADELKVPFDESLIQANGLLNSSIKRRLDNMTDDFLFISTEDFVNNNLPFPIDCAKCL